MAEIELYEAGEDVERVAVDREKALGRRVPKERERELGVGVRGGVGVECMRPSWWGGAMQSDRRCPWKSSLHRPACVGALTHTAGLRPTIVRIKKKRT